MAESQSLSSLVLIACHGEWVGRSVESVLEQHGYSVLRVESGARVLQLVRSINPDALILDSALEDVGGIELCSALRSDPFFDAAIPIFITAPAPVSNRIRAAAHEAGAWDFCSHPLDVRTLLLKLETFLRARRHLRASFESSLLDPITGLYSERGLLHWAEKIGARAARNHEPLACLALTTRDGTDAGRSAMALSATLTHLADVCRSHARKSDIVGYVGESRFAILAPETDGSGARQFIDRLQRTLRPSLPDDIVDGSSNEELQVGFYAVSDFGTAGIDAGDVVRRAERALSFVSLQGSRHGAFSYDELPQS
jgi:PleD family two-component response regulator